jgi:hypothetical protein
LNEKTTEDYPHCKTKDIYHYAIFILCIIGDSPTYLPASTSLQQHRRHVGGVVNNHRSIPPLTSSTPPQRSSTSEQQLLSATHRLSFGKLMTMMNNDHIDVQNQTKM